MNSLLEIKEFCNKHDQDFSLNSIESIKKEELWDVCLISLDSEVTNECLTCLRILSRDENIRTKMTSESILSKLFDFAFNPLSYNLDNKSALEALKILSNIIFKNPETITFLRSMQILQNIIDRLISIEINNETKPLLLLYLKLIFLLTGLDTSLRKELADIDGSTAIFLDILKKLNPDCMNPVDIDILCDFLKALYNLLHASSDCDNSLQTNQDIPEIICILKKLFQNNTINDNHKTVLLSQFVNLLNITPNEFYKYLLFNGDVKSDQSPSLKSIGSNIDPMHFIQILIDYLDNQIKIVCAQAETGLPPNSEENICPLLNCFCRACKSNRQIRKYCRLKILPYLGNEVMQLPEKGDSIRNRLCQLLTYPLYDVCELVALLLFILCKENLDRAIKYTGFGNLAGFITRNSLLRVNKTKRPELTKDELGSGGDGYSSTSTESETEIYENLKDNINPVTGRWEEPKPNPMEGLSEEQKEYLAMQLVEKIDKLERSGLIQPGTIGEDGKVKPVTHVLEMLQSVDICKKSSDSDSDE